METTLMILLGFGLAAALGIAVAAPAYWAGKFAHQQILDNKYYVTKTSRLKTFMTTTPVVGCAGLILGATMDFWYGGTILLSFTWGAALGFLSLENFADFASRLPQAPQPK